MKNNDLLGSVMESPQDVAVFALDTHYRYITFTQAHRKTIKRIWGVEIEEGMNMLDVISNPIDREKARRHFDRALQGEHFIEVEEYGEPQLYRTTYENRYGPVYGDGVVVSGLTVLVVDIIERKRLEDDLRKSENQFREVLENSQDASYKRNLQTNTYDYLSPVFARISGYTPNEIKSLSLKAILNLIHPDDLAETERLFGESLSGIPGKAYQLEYRFKHKEGHYRWFQDRFTVMRDASGQPLALIGSVSDITERKRSEEAVRESEINFRHFFQTIGDLIFVATHEGRILFANQAVERKLGYSANELSTMHILELHPADLRQEAEKVFADMFQGARETCPLPLTAKSGVLIPVETRVWFGRWNGENCIFGLSKDLSMELEAQQRFERLFRHNPTLMAISSLTDRRFFDVNDIFLKTLGYDRNEVIGKTCEELGLFANPEQQTVTSNTLQASGRITDVELQIRRKNGATIDGLFSGELISSQGRQYFLTVMVDITERKRAEAVLQESLLFRREAEKIARVGAWKANPKTDYLYWTEGVYEILEAPLDYKPSLEEGFKFCTPESIPQLQQALTRALSNGTPFVIEAGFTTTTGKCLWIEVRGLARVKEGEQAFVMGTFQDITARKKAEEALEQSELEFRAMFEVASIGMAQADITTGQWLRANKQMCAITGYSPEEILRMRIRDHIHPEDRQRDSEMFQQVIRGEMPHYRIEKRYVRKNGDLTWVNVNMTVVRNAAGHPLRTMATIEDITERKRLESHLRQAQKLEAIGQLAGGVAHDFNNILAVMMTHLGLLRMNSNLDSETQQAMKELDAEARRAAELTRQLLMFGRRSVLAVKPLDLNDIVVNLLKMLGRLIGEHIDLCFNEKADQPMVEADAGMMEQVLMNLVVNARDAMPKGGRITISTAHADLETAQAAANPVRRPGRFVCLAVSDTGSGIDAATLKRIFEPFFTTKEVGKGTGLGLATVHGIVAQHKGWVEVDSEVGQGTTFRVYLPAVNRSPVKIEQATKAKPLGGGRETILLVEDDLNLRRLVGHTLRVLGYKVYEAVSGVEAMTLWQMHGLQADLLFTDMVMPEGMSGLELIEELRALKPDLKAIVSSGYSAEMVEAGAPTKAGFVYLPKPFDAEVLAKVVRDCLDKNEKTLIGRFSQC